MDTESEVIELIRELCPEYDDSVRLEKQVDSVALYSLIPRLEERFGVEIFSIEMTPETLSSANSLAQLIERKTRPTA